jgi:hypothetical protein
MESELSERIHKHPPLIRTFIKINPTLHFNSLSLILNSLYKNHPLTITLIQTQTQPRIIVCSHLHGLSGKFPNVQNSPPLRRPSGARQVLLSSNEFDEPRRENRIALSCLVIVLCFFM